MCTQFTKLVEMNDYRHIWQCEHGTIHLGWDLVTIYLTPTEFEHMAQLLERGAQMTEPAKISQQPGIIVYKSSSFYQLWWRNVAINLTPLDFVILLNLARTALKMVHKKHTLTLVSRPADKMFDIFQQTVKASSSMPFSMN